MNTEPTKRSKSHYAQKRDSGQQMYGPGCCAHKVTDAQIQRAKDAARSRGHFEPVYAPRIDAYSERMRRSLSWDVYMGRGAA